MSGPTRYGRIGDVRGFYAQLGIPLPTRASTEAPVRCFADPAAHRREDRAPSCSISLLSGAFNCHACGARGGAYDAAISLGLSPRQAIDLMIDRGLTERRQGQYRNQPAMRYAPRTLPRSTAASEIRLDVSDRQLVEWCNALLGDAGRISQLRWRRGWAPKVLREHVIGWDGTRITIPVRQSGELAAVLRYSPPGRRRGPKMVAVPGSRQALFPDPAQIDAATLWLVEGHPDALSAGSAGLPAVAVPGARSWRPEWAELLVGRDVSICLDCDDEGRAAARRIADDLVGLARRTRIVDLAPGRNDGYDITDALLAVDLDGSSLTEARPLGNHAVQTLRGENTPR